MRERLQISRIMPLSQRKEAGRRSGHLRATYRNSPMPTTYWAITVATAAPAMPKGSTITNNKSSPMFKKAEMPRNQRGVTELPMARSRQEKKLYKKVATRPAKIIKRYSRMEAYNSGGICKKIRIGSRNT